MHLFFNDQLKYVNKFLLDSNKFGQKMLEKFGWTSGKGLGANEQGMVEHVRVKFKDDSGGKYMFFFFFSISNCDLVETSA